MAAATGFSLVVFAAIPATQAAPAGTSPKPEQVVKDLFSAIERGDKLAITSLMASSGSIIQQEVREAGTPCYFQDCTDSMSVQSFSSTISFVTPLKARYKLSKAKTKSETSSISGPYSFITPAYKTNPDRIFKCGDATFTLIKANGRWLVSGFTYTDQIDRSRCKIRD